MKSSVLIAILVIALIVIAGMILKDVMPTSSTQDTIQAQAPSASHAKVKIEDLTVGTGKEAKSGDTVVVHYTGTLQDGTKFDSSYDHGEPYTTQIGTGAVIKGWDDGIPGMKVGGKRRLTIPPELGYGSAPQGSIPPNSTLIFEVELVDVK